MGKTDSRFHYPLFYQSKKSVRIGTGFFTVQGYNLLRPYLENKAVYILVGYDETQNENLEKKLIDDIMAHLRRWDSQNRREAVEDLVGKLERGEFYIVEKGESEFIDGRIRRNDHGKVYILDDEIVLTGSLNLTVNGLLMNDESQTSIDDPERVRNWLDLFEAKWTAPDTYDLTQALLEALKEWLKLHIPYDVYLKTILAIIQTDDIKAPRATYKMPAEYQEVIVTHLLSHLSAYRGAFLVASTGLGKTIMATHVCYRLLRDNKIGNVIIFAPDATHPDWKEALDNAMINNKVFTRQLLDMKTRGGKGKELLETLDKVDNKYLIILDETQYFRNEVRQAGDQRRSFQRLIEVVNSRDCLVLLLTATPYAKGVEDLNNQLMLLPHTAPLDYRLPTGQIVMEGFEDGILSPNGWRVNDLEDYFEQFMNLPVCTVVSTSWVAKNYGISTEQGDYVERPDKVGWLPQIEIGKIRVPAPYEEEITASLNKGYFKHEWMRFKSRGQWQRTQSNIENLVTVAWASSPLALQEVLYKTIHDLYDSKFLKNQEEREQILSPIFGKLSEQTYDKDPKFNALCDLLSHHPKEKIIIFTERLSTAAYLEEMLHYARPDLKVASVVRQKAKFEYELKDFENEVYEMILDFAPEANQVKNGNREQSYDVFIFTDAYSMGVNLQDASVVINYDLAWTADTLIQRAGRILRFWSRPRQVSIYIFIGDYKFSEDGANDSKRVDKRLEQLTLRSKQAERFSELPMITETDRATYTSLGDLSSLTIEHLGRVDVTQVEEFSGGSRFLKHITELKQNSLYAEAIPDDISSAMLYPEHRHKIYLLIRHAGKYYWTLYDIKSKTLKSLDEDSLLNMLQCTKETIIAGIEVQNIEEHAQNCKALLCKQLAIDPNDAERICALYLKPEADATDDELQTMLSSSMNRN